MEFVRVRHPKTGGEASVPKSSLAHHARAGWEPVDGSTPVEAPAPAGEHPQTAADESAVHHGEAEAEPVEPSQPRRPRRPTSIEES